MLMQENNKNNQFDPASFAEAWLKQIEGYMERNPQLQDELRKSFPNTKDLEHITFNGYQDFVKTMKVYPEKHAIVYPTMGISGEAGEVSEKVKKWLRGDRELDKLELLKEAGDVLWYLASLADDLGFTFQDMVDENVKKLSSRKERGVTKGDGDNR